MNLAQVLRQSFAESLQAFCFQSPVCFCLRLFCLVCLHQKLRDETQYVTGKGLEGAGASDRISVLLDIPESPSLRSTLQVCLRF